MALNQRLVDGFAQLLRWGRLLGMLGFGNRNSGVTSSIVASLSVLKKRHMCLTVPSLFLGLTHRREQCGQYHPGR